MDPTSEKTPALSPEGSGQAPLEAKPESDTKPEAAPAKGAEQAGSKINKLASAPPLVLPPVAPDQTISSTPPPIPRTDIGSSPAIADDVDVIEKEWVEKARQIVNQTKNDPYRQEQAVEQLQRAYLKKRYNKDLKDPLT